MEVSKGYIQTEIGRLPVDWLVKPIAEICTTSKARISPTASKQNYKCVELEHLSQGTGQLLGYADSNTLKSQKSVFSRGDVLFGKLRPYLRKYLHPNFDGVCTTEIWVLKHASEIDDKWLYYLIQSDRFIEAANQSTGTKMPRAEWKTVSGLLVGVPSTSEEQTAIATALSAADALISSLEALIAKKRNIKQGAMQQLLQPKEGWEVKRLGEVLTVRHGKSQKDIETNDGLYPILGTGGPMGKTNTWLYNKESVLIGRKGTIDRPQYLNTPFWTVDTLFYTEIQEGYSAKFIFYMFLMIDWYGYNEASGVPSLNAKTIEKIEIGFPDYSIQSEIAGILSEMDKEISVLETKLEKYKQIKQGMMQQLLTGKIRLV